MTNLEAYLKLEEIMYEFEISNQEDSADKIREIMDEIWVNKLNSNDIQKLKNRKGTYPEYIGKL